MSIFASFDCSISRATRTRPRALSMLLSTAFDTVEHASRQSRFRSSKKTSSQSFTTSTQQFEKLFIHALVRAGQCSKHSTEKKKGFFQSCTAGRPPSCRQLARSVSSRRPKSRTFSSRTDTQSPAEGVATRMSKEELKGLVDYYNSAPEDTLHVPSLDLSGDDPELLIPPDPPPEDEKVEIERTVQELQNFVQHEAASYDQIWDAYQRLPPPRAFYLPNHLLGNLLHHLSIVPYKTEPTMMRYLSLIEDAQAINAPIKASHWTSAISFAGRCLRKISSSEVESALHLWRRMEHDAGVRGTNVTFNVLFDLATKAGKFVLAEMIMKEMETRNLRFNRHFRTALIYHYGLRRDGNGVRKAYRDLVDAGEIVDSAVITCVVQSLLKCGEAVAAEQVFERAKRLHWQKTTEYEDKLAANAHQNNDSSSESPPSMDNDLAPPPMPPTDWRASRQLGMHLDRTAHLLRQTPDPTARDRIQNSVPLAPSIRTYRALIYYHAVTAGDIDRATELLTEMPDHGVEVDGICYLHLFKGFSMHGGVAYSGWTRRRLERLWKDFCARVELNGVGWRVNTNAGPAVTFSTAKFYLSTAAIEYVLRAYARVVGYERAWEIWEEVKAKWEGSMELADLEYVDQVLDRLHPEWRGGGIGDGEDGVERDGDWEEEERQEEELQHVEDVDGKGGDGPSI